MRERDDRREEKSDRTTRHGRSPFCPIDARRSFGGSEITAAFSPLQQNFLGGRREVPLAGETANEKPRERALSHSQSMTSWVTASRRPRSLCRIPPSVRARWPLIPRRPQS